MPSWWKSRLRTSLVSVWTSLLFTPVTSSVLSATVIARTPYGTGKACVAETASGVIARRAHASYDVSHS